jgi:hypothetical protein
LTAFVLEPARIANFGDSDGAAFVLVTTEDVGRSIQLMDDARKYSSLSIALAHSKDDIEPLFSALPAHAHVLVVLPNIYFPSPTSETLGPRRKLAVLACNSTPTSSAMVHHFLMQAYKTDPRRQELLAEKFFNAAEVSSYLTFSDDRYGCAATFKIHDDDLQWHEQIGTLAWGQQQLLPSGEVSTLPVSVYGEDIKSTLSIDGTLALHGFPVLHTGRQSVRLEDQKRLFQELATVETAAIIATVEHGRITKFEPTGAASRPAVNTLEALSAVDSRYRTIVEVGLGLNTELELFPGNSAMNEVYGGPNGVVHFGIGLSPFTQYHLDLVCPDTKVKDSRDQILFGPI